MRHLPMTTQQEREGVFAQDLTQGFIVIFISNILEKTTNTARGGDGETNGNFYDKGKPQQKIFLLFPAGFGSQKFLAGIIKTFPIPCSRRRFLCFVLWQ